MKILGVFSENLHQDDLLQIAVHSARVVLYHTGCFAKILCEGSVCIALFKLLLATVLVLY